MEGFIRNGSSKQGDLGGERGWWWAQGQEGSPPPPARLWGRSCGFWVGARVWVWQYHRATLRWLEGIVGDLEGLESRIKCGKNRERSQFFWHQGYRGYPNGFFPDIRYLPRRDLGSISRDLGALWGSVRRSVKVEFGEGGKRGVGRFNVISFVNWVR